MVGVFHNGSIPLLASKYKIKDMEKIRNKKKDPVFSNIAELIWAVVSAILFICAGLMIGIAIYKLIKYGI